MSDSPSPTPTQPWYSGVTRYQWIILIIASVGWIFDVYEGQIFNITRGAMLKDILGDLPEAEMATKVSFWGDVFLGVFLAGGTAGGLLFGSLADKVGRKPIMIATILTYSVFSGLTYFADSLSQVAILRFFVAMGVGGEWAVAASLVAEVFPKHARTHASGIFHASSVIGTWAATAAGIAVNTNWRYAYLIGVVPALLVVGVRIWMREPDSWKKTAKSEDTAKKRGSLSELLKHPVWGKRALQGMGLAAVGLGSFWGVIVAGQNLAGHFLAEAGVAPEIAAQKAKFAYGVVQTTGAGIGLLAFGPICSRIGRKKAFIWAHLGSAIMVPVICYVPWSYNSLLCLMPVFGFFTLSMHAGYAIYFPELFPNHLRATGTSFCFNVGRLVAVPMLFFSGWLKAELGPEQFRLAFVILGLFFFVGLIIVTFMPETKGQDLPE